MKTKQVSLQITTEAAIGIMRGMLMSELGFQKVVCLTPGRHGKVSE